jgi:hypothetical protein
MEEKIVDVKLKNESDKKQSAWITVAAIGLVIFIIAWWVLILPSASEASLVETVGVVAQSLAAVIGIMVVASIFAFSKIDDCRKKMAQAKPEYMNKLKATSEGRLVELKREIHNAIEASDSIEQREEWLEKLYNVSVLSCVVMGSSDDEIDQAKNGLVKSGYADRYYLNRFEDYILAASVDEMTFFQFVEEILGSATYRKFKKGEEVVEAISDDFFKNDSIYDDLWTVRGGAETTGPFFKASVIVSCITVMIGFLFLPAVSQGLFNGAEFFGIEAYKLFAGIVVTLGVSSFFVIARYILRVIGGRY